MELNKNPFYILNIPCDADRAAIHEAADELAFFDEDGSVERAQSALLNPSQRLAAELDWFPGLSKASVDQLRKQLDSGRALSLPPDADALSLLNISTFNLRNVQTSALPVAIRQLDTYAAQATPQNILPVINAVRTRAKMAAVSENDVIRELNRKRAEIRQTITDSMSSVPDTDYVRMVTGLAEMLGAQTEHGGVIEDVVDQYEIRMHDQIKQLADQIRSHILLIMLAGNVSPSDVDSLIQEVRNWDSLAQPIQLKGQSSGLTHEESKELGNELRKLAVFLHNEKHETELAAKIAKAMQSVFAELNELAASFSKDYEQLSQMGNQKEALEVIEAIEKFKQLCKTDSPTDATRLVSEAEHIQQKARELNRMLLDLKNIDPTQRTQLRTLVCAIARAAAIFMHNTISEAVANTALARDEATLYIVGTATGKAADIMDVLNACFSDVPDFGTKLRSEAQQLRSMAGLSVLAGRNRSVGSASRGPYSSAYSRTVSTSGSAAKTAYSSASSNLSKTTSGTGSSGEKKKSKSTIITIVTIVAVALMLFIAVLSNVGGVFDALHHNTGASRFRSGDYQGAYQAYSTCRNDSVAKNNAAILGMLLEKKAYAEAADLADSCIENGTTDLSRAQWTSVFTLLIAQTPEDDIETILSGKNAIRTVSQAGNVDYDAAKQGLASKVPSGKMVDGIVVSKEGGKISSMEELYKKCAGDPDGKVLIVAEYRMFSSNNLDRKVLWDLMGELPDAYYPKSLDEVEYVILLSYDYEVEGYYFGGLTSCSALRENGKVSVISLPGRKTIYDSPVKEGWNPPESFVTSSTSSQSWNSGGAPGLQNYLLAGLAEIRALH